MAMKTLAIAAVVVLVLCFESSLALTGAKKSDPCINKYSNAEIRQCYEAEQARVNAEADLGARDLAAEFRKQAQDPTLGSVVTEELRKAGSAVTESQKLWRVYRDRHCNAVAHSWTTGSGAGQAAEKCLFRLGEERLQELRIAFK